MTPGGADEEYSGCDDVVSCVGSKRQSCSRAVMSCVERPGSNLGAVRDRENKKIAVAQANNGVISTSRGTCMLDRISWKHPPREKASGD